MGYVITWRGKADGPITEGTMVVPGYDHRSTKPGGGVHGAEIHHAVRAMLPASAWTQSTERGPYAALVLSVFTARLPDGSTMEPIRPGFYPHINELILHVQTGIVVKRECEWVGRCDPDPWRTGLVRDHLPGMTKDVKDPAWGAWPSVWGDVDHPNLVFWASMRAKLGALTSDPALFPQPDEPAALRGARESLAHARELVTNGNKLVTAWESRVAELMLEYTKGRPS